ncbi:helix-turn-helix domain-containing protein [Streptomyces sp. NBC_01803]|uniref:helix-turn-helix domain-containing protein n=1 Tax=Streptomyces sp. NBC_01803 TaxID=2975946 RepID=UPI003FA38A77
MTRARPEPRAGGEADDAAGPGSRATAALTARQWRVARAVAEGRTNREVAARLSLSPRTVVHHLRDVYTALGVRSRVELVRALGTFAEKLDPARATGQVSGATDRVPRTAGAAERRSVDRRIRAVRRTVPGTPGPPGCPDGRRRWWRSTARHR